MQRSPYCIDACDAFDSESPEEIDIIARQIGGQLLVFTCEANRIPELLPPDVRHDRKPSIIGQPPMANRPDGVASSEPASYPRLDPQLSTVVSAPSPTPAVSSVRDPRGPPISATTTTTRFEHESASMMDVDRNSAADDRSRRATSVLSMDDIEAAQALEGLRSGKDKPD